MLHTSIQPGQMFGAWQNQLQKWAEQDKTFLHHWLGGCEICTSSFVSFMSIPVYMAFMYGIDAWQLHGLIVNIIWLIIYWSLGTNLNLLFLVKLFEKK